MEEIEENEKTVIWKTRVKSKLTSRVHEFFEMAKGLVSVATESVRILLVPEVGELGSFLESIEPVSCVVCSGRVGLGIML